MPKEKKQNKHSGKIWQIIACVFLIIIFVQCIIIFMYNSTGSLLEEKKDNIVSLDNIETPIVDLIYHSSMVKCLKAIVSNTRPYEVTILADMDKATDIELLTFYFDELQGTYLGKIEDKKGNIVTVNVEKHNFNDWKNLSVSEIDRLVKTQGDLLDEIVANFPYVEISNQTKIEEFDETYINIDTPYVQLLYPKKWENYLETRINEKNSLTVTFYCKLPNREKIEMFTYTFGGKDGILIGKLNQTEIRVSINNNYVIDEWKPEEKEIFYAMQEDMNIIIDTLLNKDGFQIVKK